MFLVCLKILNIVSAKLNSSFWYVFSVTLSKWRSYKRSSGVNNYLIREIMIVFIPVLLKWWGEEVTDGVLGGSQNQIARGRAAEQWTGPAGFSEIDNRVRPPRTIFCRQVVRSHVGRAPFTFPFHAIFIVSAKPFSSPVDTEHRRWIPCGRCVHWFGGREQ